MSEQSKLQAWEVTLDGEWRHSHTVHATTRGQAKMEYVRYLDDCAGMDPYLRINARKIKNYEPQWTDSLRWHEKSYGLQGKLIPGGYIHVGGNPLNYGRIIGARSGIEAKRNDGSSFYAHPTWQIRYFDRWGTELWRSPDYPETGFKPPLPF